MLNIQTTGFSDYLDDSANIRLLIIGGPGVGKTRFSSFWPKPFLVDCEGNRGSLTDRAMPFVRVRSSKDMLDTLEYLKSLERVPKAQRRFQTVVIDTADSFQRIVKDEWVQQTKAQMFSGFDAWGYLDTKMQMLFTRLLNLDVNVIVLVHHKDKTHKEGDATVREYGLQMSGAIADQIFNDFGLVGWMGTHWEAEEGKRVQKRGITFHPTPEKWFLKDTFGITPAYMPITLDSEQDYQQFMDAFTAKLEGGSIPENEVIGEIPDAVPTGTGAGSTPPPVNPPAEGGPLPSRPPVPPAEVPLEKKLKGELEEIAKGLGITVRGNMLKSELVEAIKAKQEFLDGLKEERTPTKSEEILDSLQQVRETPVGEVTPPLSPAPADTAPTSTSGSASNPSPPANDGPSAPTPSPTSETTSGTSPSPSSNASEPSSGQPSEDPWAPPAGSEAAKAGAVGSEAAVALVEAQLGGEVISETPADASAKQEATAPSTPVDKPSAPQGPSVCADCHNNLAPDWADVNKKNFVRLSFVKFRRYLCASCYQAAV